MHYEELPEQSGHACFGEPPPPTRTFETDLLDLIRRSYILNSARPCSHRTESKEGALECVSSVGGERPPAAHQEVVYAHSKDP